MGAGAGTDVELRLSAVTENFKTEMKASAREISSWGKGINDVSRSVSAFTGISGSIGQVFEGVSKGNYGEVFKGIGGSVRELALGIPAMSAGFRTAIGIMQGLAPLAMQIAGVALPIAALAAAVYMGMAAWNSYNESQLAVINAGKALHESLVGPVIAGLEATRKRVQDLNDELAVLGESPASQKLIKAQAEYEKNSRAYFGNLKLLEEQENRVLNANGEMLQIEYYQLKALEDKTKGLREWMKASSEEIASIEKMTAAQKRLEASQKWRENVKQFGDWSVGGQTPMSVTSGVGIDVAVHEEVQRALADINTGAMVATREALKRIDSVARIAGEEYVASLSAAPSAFEDTTADAYNLAANIFGPQLVSDVVDFANSLSDAMESAVDAAKSAGQGFLSSLNLSYQTSESTEGLTEAEKERAIKEERINAGLDVMRGAIQGAQQGGIWGAIGGALATMLSRMKGFMGMLSVIGEGFGKLTDSSKPIMDALGPVIILLGKFGEIIGQAIIPILNTILVPVLKMLFEVLKVVGLAVMYVIKGLGTAWNWIIDAVNSVLGWLDIDISSLKFNMNGLNRSIDQLHDMTISSANDQMDAAENTTDSLSGLGDVADSVAESLSNIPSGYKVAMARYNAINAAGVSGSSAGVYGNYSSITIGNLNVVSDDPREMFKKVQNEAARRNLVRTGMRLAYVGSPYLGR